MKRGSWKRSVETLLSNKKQFLEDTTNKQVLSIRCQLEEREREAFKKEWVSFSKEETSHVTLGELNQKTVVGLLVQELIPERRTDRIKGHKHKRRIYVDFRGAGRVGTPRSVGL